MAKTVITNPEDLYTVQGDLVTENYDLGLIGWKNPNNFIKHDESFMKIDTKIKEIDNTIIGFDDDKQDKTDNNLQTDAKQVVPAINEVAKYTDGLATSKTVNSFPLSQATEGEVYRVPQTNKFVVCVENYNGSEISLPNANFEELSVWKNKEKIHSLSYGIGELLYNVSQPKEQTTKFNFSKLIMGKVYLIDIGNYNSSGTGILTPYPDEDYWYATIMQGYNVVARITLNHNKITLSNEKITNINYFRIYDLDIKVKEV